MYRACIARSYVGTRFAGDTQTHADNDSENKEENESTEIGLEIEVSDLAFYLAFANISDVYCGECPSQFVPLYPYPVIVKLAPYGPAALSGDEASRNTFVLRHKPLRMH